GDRRALAGRRAADDDRRRSVRVEEGPTAQRLSAGGTLVDEDDEGGAGAGELAGFGLARPPACGTSGRVKDQGGERHGEREHASRRGDEAELRRHRMPQLTGARGDAMVSSASDRVRWTLWVCRARSSAATGTP